MTSDHDFSEMKQAVAGALKEFDLILKEKDTNKAQVSALQAQIVAKKNKDLYPIKILLKKLLDMHIRVSHYEVHNSRHHLPSEEFKVYQGESSPSWAPGQSLLFDHPAQVEIAIPNHPEKEGVIIISFATHHPDSGMFHKKFTNMADACKALAVFIARNTVSRKT